MAMTRPISEQVTFTQEGAGAVERLASEKLREWVSIKDFGAVGDGVTDDSSAIQAAIDDGLTVQFPEGIYLANNISQVEDYQRFCALGEVIIKKNASGALFTSSGDHVELSGIKFYGDASSPTYTGHNIVSSGDHLRLINCGSRWAYARALLATGNHVQIIGTSDIYQTVDATSNGYDIEIGVSGTATLYHQLYSVYSSQATGGIKLIDTGSAVICGGQFGKLTIGAGTSPGGVNGGNTIGARILGNITVELSNAVFEGNTFSNVTLTFAAGTSGCRAGISNAYASGFTVVNNGNADNLYELSNGSGASAGITYSAGLYPLEHLSLRQNKATRARKADDSGWYNMLYGITGDATCVDSGAGGIYLISNGTTLWQAESTSFRPHTDNAYSLGSSGQRASVVYASTGTINTSDAREKRDIEDIPESWLRAWRKVKVEAIVEKPPFETKPILGKVDDAAEGA